MVFLFFFGLYFCMFSAPLSRVYQTPTVIRLNVYYSCYVTNQKAFLEHLVEKVGGQLKHSLHGPDFLFFFFVII